MYAMATAGAGLAARAGALAGLERRSLLRQLPRLVDGAPSRHRSGSGSGFLRRPGTPPPSPGGGGGHGGSSHRGGMELKLFALPSYKIARKNEDDLAPDAAGDSPGSGGRFPFKDEFEVSKGLFVSGQQVHQALTPLMTQERIRRIEQVCAARSFNVLPIVEGLYDMGNLAAVCRSADALGFGAVHVVRNLKDERYKQSKRSSAGADKWLDVQVWNTTEDCLRHVKKLGYQVVVTHLSPGAVDISQIDWSRPTAFLMGNEERGVSEEAVALADACAVVPMVGFVDSFNISVAAALIMYEARRCREEKLGAHGDLTPEEQSILKSVFFLRNKGQTREYIQHLLDRPPPQWQAHRNGGDWGDKSFDEDEAAAADGSSEQQQRLPRQRLQTTQCYYWDGCCCWGERFLWPGKQCRYIGAHNEGVSTFNHEKLKQQCDKKGVPFPDLSNPPPMPPLRVQLAPAGPAELAAAAKAAAAAEAAEAEAARTHGALLAAAATTAATGAAPPATAAATGEQ